MAARLRVLYVFTARKRRLLDLVRRGQAPDTLLFGLNHMAGFDVGADFYEPAYGRAGHLVARQVGRLGPDALQLRVLPQLRRYDAVVLTGAWPLLIAAQLIPAARRPKLIWLNLSLTNLLRRRTATAGLLRRALRYASAIACVSSHQQRFLAQRLGLPAARLPLTLSGTDAQFFQPGASGGDGATPRRQHTILAAGRDPGRDYRTLLEAARTLDARLCIVCSPANLAGLQLPADVRVRYDIPPIELRREYATAGAVAVPTAADESTAGSDCSGTLVLLDALAMGRPAVATHRASIPDYVEPSRHALTVPPRDPAALAGSLSRLLADPAAAAEMARAGRAHVLDHLTTKHFAGRLAEVIHRLAGGAGGQEPA